MFFFLNNWVLFFCEKWELIGIPKRTYGLVTVIYGCIIEHKLFFCIILNTNNLGRRLYKINKKWVSSKHLHPRSLHQHQLVLAEVNVNLPILANRSIGHSSDDHMLLLGSMCSWQTMIKLCHKLLHIHQLSRLRSIPMSICILRLTWQLSLSSVEYIICVLYLSTK